MKKLLMVTAFATATLLFNGCAGAMQDFSKFADDLEKKSWVKGETVSETVNVINFKDGLKLYEYSSELTSRYLESNELKSFVANAKARGNKAKLYSGDFNMKINARIYSGEKINRYFNKVTSTDTTKKSLTSLPIAIEFDKDDNSVSALSPATETFCRYNTCNSKSDASVDVRYTTFADSLGKSLSMKYTKKEFDDAFLRELN
ncbi:MAG: hypothetical protein ACEQSQ_11120 [Candidatus Paceibacteria bacterium]